MVNLRTTGNVGFEVKKKLSLFCGIRVDDIICNLKVPNIYFVPQTFENQDVCSKLLPIGIFPNKIRPDLA